MLFYLCLNFATFRRHMLPLHSVVSCSNFFQNDFKPVTTRLHGGTSHRRPIVIHCRANFRSLVLENVQINYLYHFSISEKLERCGRCVLNGSCMFYSSGWLQSNFFHAGRYSTSVTSGTWLSSREMIVTVSG